MVALALVKAGSGGEWRQRRGEIWRSAAGGGDRRSAAGRLEERRVAYRNAWRRIGGRHGLQHQTKKEKSSENLAQLISGKRRNEAVAESSLSRSGVAKWYGYLFLRP